MSARKPLDRSGRRVVLRGIGAALASAVAPPAARAAEAARSYAVLSLIGDRMTVVTRQMATGSLLERATRQELPLPDDTFDVAAALAARRAIRAREPDAAVELFAPRDAKLYELQERLLDAAEPAAALATSLRQVVEQSRATHVLLIAKYRGETRVALDDVMLGSGKLAGIGFYVDPDYAPADPSRRTGHVGFFAPYAYLRVTLLEAATLRPLREAVNGAARAAVGEGERGAPVAWQSLDAAQKVRALRAAIEAAVQEAVPKVLAPS